MTVAISTEGWAGPRTSHHCSCSGESQRNCRRLLPLTLLPLTPSAFSFHTRRAPRYGILFLGQGRGQKNK